MNSQMYRINLKMAAVVATILTMVTSLAPDAAHARTGGGPSVRSFTTEFDLNTSVVDSNNSDDTGVFSGAIENFTLCFNPLDPDAPCSLKNVSPSGTITASIIQTENRNNDPLISQPISINGSEDIRNVTVGELTASAPGFEKTALQYEITFDSDRNDKLFLFLPSTGNESLDREKFINSLSGIDGAIVARGVFYGIDNLGNVTEDLYGIGDNDNPITIEPTTSTAVPEPGDTVGLIATGALGAVFMLKRKKCFRKIS